MSLFAKQGERFYIDADTKQIFRDQESHRWTLSYYKTSFYKRLIECINGHRVLDPFGGSGYSSAAALTLTSMDTTFVINDIAYRGGDILDSKKGRYHYHPERNIQALDRHFTTLPHWARPHLSHRISGYTCNDARHLGYDTFSFDYVFSELPFGKNCPSGNPKEEGFFRDVFKESLRVAKKGAIFIVLDDWLPTIKDICANHGFEIEEVSPNLTLRPSKKNMRAVKITLSHLLDIFTIDSLN
jgi:16S rRNA G966 N2-methylase RsmD